METGNQMILNLSLGKGVFLNVFDETCIPFTNAMRHFLNFCDGTFLCLDATFDDHLPFMIPTNIYTSCRFTAESIAHYLES